MVSVSISDEVNPKQVQAFNALFGAIAYHDELKRARAEGKEPPKPDLPSDAKWTHMYGGAIRGGKTFLFLAVFVLLCRMFPGSRWHVIRASFPDLQRNTIPSLMRILLSARGVRWKRSSSDYYVRFPNGSRIYFMSENFKQDRDLNRFKGLETNGFLLEQIEELQYETYQKAIERAGSFYIEKMPPPLVLATLNPAYNWVHEIVYEAWEKLGDAAPFHYTVALPSDNSKVTPEQWEQWERLDPKTYARYIAGSWELDVKGRFMHAFRPEVHVVDEVAYEPSLPLYYSFDFNVDPSCAIVFQTDKRTFFHVLSEVRMENSDTPQICDALKVEWRPANPLEYVTGDASGLNRMSGLRGALNQYQVIKREMRIPEDRFVLPKANPGIADSRVFCNSIFAHFPSVKIARRCKFLVHDLNFVEIRRDSDGVVGIKKTGKLTHAPMGAESMGHLLDALRYGMHVTLYDFVTLPKS